MIALLKEEEDEDDDVPVRRVNSDAFAEAKVTAIGDATLMY